MPKNTKDDRIALGRKGEEAAAAFLERVGFRILDRNWRHRSGELDIVAIEGETLVLCEVKTRRGVSTGSPEESVTPTKQKRIARLAAAYLAGMADAPGSVRFDVVSIMVLGEDRALLRHHRGAFEVSG